MKYNIKWLNNRVTVFLNIIIKVNKPVKYYYLWLSHNPSGFSVCKFYYGHIYGKHPKFNDYIDIFKEVCNL